MNEATTLERIPVTVDNFVRAETDRTFASVAVESGVGKFFHYRQLAPIENQHVQRGNRDTLYSVAILDLDAGPVTIALPDAGGRFMTLETIDEDHYVVDVVYDTRPTRLERQAVGTRYALAAVRTLVNPNDPDDIARVHALQDAISVSQPGGPGRLELPKWDSESRKKLTDALSVLGSTLTDWTGAAGASGEVDPIRHLIVTATGWGLNPKKDATYLNVVPQLNDGKTVHRLTIKDVPVDGFWSVTVYNAEGYLEANARNAYSFNNITAKKDADGGITIQFGGCDGDAPNCIPIMAGWNYTVRLYRPRAEILDGTWAFPEAKPVS